MSEVHRVQHVASAMLLVVAAVAGCGTSSVTPSPAPTTSPPPQTSAPLLALTETFKSGLYGYSIKYPVTFVARSATKELQGAAAPLIDGEEVDQLSWDAGAVVVLASAMLPSGTDTLDEWTATTARTFCDDPATTEPVTLGGEPGTLSTFATCAGLFHQWVTAVRDGRGYHVVWAHDLGSEASDREQLMAMLATFAFAPD